MYVVNVIGFSNHRIPKILSGLENRYKTSNPHNHNTLDVIWGLLVLLYKLVFQVDGRWDGLIIMDD